MQLTNGSTDRAPRMHSDDFTRFRVGCTAEALSCIRTEAEPRAVSLPWRAADRWFDLRKRRWKRTT